MFAGVHTVPPNLYRSTCKGVGIDIPWHVSAFYPAYKMLEYPPTPAATLRKAREIGLNAGLRYVYIGNVSVKGGENTYCYACQELVVERSSYSIQLLYLKRWPLSQVSNPD